MASEDEISYSGPSLIYQPPLGQNITREKDTFRTPQQRSYADPDALDQMLDIILDEVSRFTAELELELLHFAVPIPRGDSRLEEANQLEWPAALGIPKRHISYRYYRALNTRPTTSASYVRSRFEDSIRDFTGTNALDILSLVQVVGDEARLIKEFVATYIGDVDDSSEYRSFELFQDWASAAINHLVELRKVRDKAGLTFLPASEVDLTTPLEARHAQATFKIKLNAVNREITDSVAFLRKNFSEHATTFYGRFLGPALQWRLAAGRRFHQRRGTLGAEMETTTNALDANLSVLQADQLRRNLLFDAKIREITEQVTRQDAYRNYIRQLSTKGRSITAGQPDTAIEVEESPEEVEYWEDLVEDEPTAVFESLHSALAGLEEASAHPQYFLKAGDTLTGDLVLADGATIDGMVPSEHRHTGADGSRKVRGSDIEGGSVSPEVIDRTVVPDRPTGLRLIKQEARVQPPGMTVIDAHIAWDGPEDLMYEVQHSPIR